MTDQTPHLTQEQINAGQAVYSNLVLSFYDWTVIYFSNNFIWKCPSHHIQAHYQKFISNNHLEVGVGTGYFLKHCHFDGTPRIALMDLNQNCLDKCSKRLESFSPEQYKINIYDPIEKSIPLFDSLGINYVLHCLPGNILEKSVVFKHLKILLNPQAVVFGSTILGKGINQNPIAKLVSKTYNAKGIFCNLEDDLDGLKKILEKNFSSFQVQQMGSVALFWAQV